MRTFMKDNKKKLTRNKREETWVSTTQIHSGSI